LAKLLRDALSGVLPPGQSSALETGIDVIGDIAIVKLQDEAKGGGPEVGRAIMASMKSVKAVYDQEGGLEGDFRLRRLRHLAGEERTLTMHRENGMRFMVDVETCYFSPRLSTERMRIADLVQEGEVVVNMFAGVGPYSITIAKKSRVVSVHSNELNEAAYLLHLRNNLLNKVQDVVSTTNADARSLPELLPGKADRVLMPHPSQSDRFLPTAMTLVKRAGWIHYYRHVSGADVREAQDGLGSELRAAIGERVTFTCRKVREIGPHYLELVADIRAPG
jgi:tRNA (guanine37-N1)-methyltransferase